MMTPTQLSALKADILASQDMVGIPMTNAGASQIAELYNTVGAVDVPAYCEYLSAREISHADLQRLIIDKE